MGAYFLIPILAIWFVIAFSLYDMLLQIAVDFSDRLDPVKGNEPFAIIFTTLCCLLALPALIFQALMHFITITLRR